MSITRKSGRRAAVKLLTKEERGSSGSAKLPDLLRKSHKWDDTRYQVADVKRFAIDRQVGSRVMLLSHSPARGGRGHKREVVVMLRRLARTYKETLGPTWRGVTGKLSVLAKGESAVSGSCQIPEIRQKYLDLGLPRRSGIFVEIGAFDGESFSNTSFLADQGWRGLYVEPVPAFCKLVKQRHALNNIAVENVAVSDTAGSCVLHQMDSLSTINPASLEAYRSIHWARSLAEVATVVEVKTDDLDSVLARHAIPHNFDLMIVDVEGGEEPIVACLLGSPWRPKVLVVELCDKHPDFSNAIELQTSHKRIRQSIIASGYHEFYSDPVNSIFYHP